MISEPMSSPAPAMTIQDDAGANYIIVGHEPFSINNRLQKSDSVDKQFDLCQGRSHLYFSFSYEKFEFDNSFNLVHMVMVMIEDMLVHLVHLLLLVILQLLLTMVLLRCNRQ